MIIVSGLPYGGDLEISKQIQAAIARAGGPPKMLSLVLPPGAAFDVVDCELTDSYVVQEKGRNQLVIEIGSVTGGTSRIQPTGPEPQAAEPAVEPVTVAPAEPAGG